MPFIFHVFFFQIKILCLNNCNENECESTKKKKKKTLLSKQKQAHMDQIKVKSRFKRLVTCNVTILSLINATDDTTKYLQTEI